MSSKPWLGVLTLTRIGRQISVGAPLAEVAAPSMASRFSSRRLPSAGSRSALRGGGTAALFPSHASRFHSTRSTTPIITANKSRLDGLVYLSVPLPSGDCGFTIEPFYSSIGDFLDAVKVEDGGIESAVIYGGDGVPIDPSTTIHSLLCRDFDLRLNGKKVDVHSKEFDLRLNGRKDDVLSVNGRKARPAIEPPFDDLLIREKILVDRYNYRMWQEKRLRALLADLRPMEEHRRELDMSSFARTRCMQWLGVYFMAIYWGLAFRLTGNAR